MMPPMLTAAYARSADLLMMARRRQRRAAVYALMMPAMLRDAAPDMRYDATDGQAAACFRTPHCERSSFFDACYSG